MAANWMRRTVLSSVAAASVALLAACGSSSVANSIKPDSLVTFGDALSDLGQNPNGRPYSVTTTTTAVNNWTLEVADQYDLTLAPAKQGGTAYAQGNARVALRPALARITQSRLGTSKPSSARVVAMTTFSRFSESA